MRGLRALQILLACAVVDATAQTAPVAQRIVSTTPSITETLFALGLGSRVVGVTTYCRYPAEAQQLPKIGTFLEPNFERILALRPDLVITLTNPINLTGRLAVLKLRAVEVDMVGMQGTLKGIEIIGDAAGAPDKARALGASIRKELEHIRQSVAARPPRSVLFIVGRTPGTLEGLIAAGKGSYLDDLMSYAGGRNILSDSRIPYPKLSLEELFARNPDVILDMGDFAHAEGKPNERQAEIDKLWGKYPLLRAVRSKTVHALASDIYVVPGPRMVDAAREFQRLIHPEVRP